MTEQRASTSASKPQRSKTTAGDDGRRLTGYVVRSSGVSSVIRLRRRAAHIVAKEGPLRRDYSGTRSFAKEASLIFSYIFAGWNDATAGALLPAIQKRYGISFAIVSMLFVANLFGWIFAAILTPVLIRRITFGRAVSVVTALAIIPSVAIAAGAPFPLMACCYVVFGLSLGSMEAMANAWISARPNARARLSALHFAYGVGALCAPLAGTPFVSSGADFHLFFFGSLGLCVLNTIFVTASFRLRREGYPNEQLTTEEARPLPTNSDDQTPYATDEAVERNGIAMQSMTEAQAQAQNPAPANADRSSASVGQWKVILSQRDTHLLAVFCLFYVGTEVAIGGWTSTYIIDIRGDVENSGHIVSGFWAGLAAGRILLLPVTDKLGVQLAAVVYLVLSVALQAVIWFVPNIIANGVAVGLMGMLLGPLFPILIELISKRIIPRSAQTTAIAYIVAFGSAGSALFPLIVGLIVQQHGAQVLAPTLFAFLTAQTIIFLLLGKPKNAPGEAERALE